MRENNVYWASLSSGGNLEFATPSGICLLGFACSGKGQIGVNAWSR
jgi:hypothetical protein